MPTFQDYHYPKQQTYVAELRDATITAFGLLYNDRGIMLDHWAAKRNYVYWVSSFFGKSMLDETSIPIPGYYKSKRIQEHDILAVAQGHDPENYYHFLTNIATKVMLLLDILKSDQDIPLFVPSRQRYQQEILMALGISENRVVAPFGASGLRGLAAKVLDTHRAHTVLFSSWVDPQHPPGELMRDLRAELLRGLGCQTGESKPDKVLLVRRLVQRDHQNHDELLARLRDDLEATVVDFIPERHSVADQARAFHEADVVIGVHGAALGNLLFCRPGTHVVEILSPRFLATHYWHLSVMMSLEYHLLLMDRTSLGLMTDAKALRRCVADILG